MDTGCIPMASRRVTGYLTNTHGVPTFIIFGEDIPTICKESEELPSLSHLPGREPPTSVTGLISQLKGLSPQRHDELSKDPFGTVVLLEAKIISSWFSFYLTVSRDLEMTDSMIGLETPNEVLFDKATFIRREVIIALDRFYRHLEAHEGFLMYVIDGTKPEWSPRVVHQELKDQVKSIKVLKIRTEQIRSRAQGLSDLIFNIVSIRQARLAIQQSERSNEMAALQRYDAKLSFNQGEAMKKISILAAIFLPLTLSTSLLGMNAHEINGANVRLWMFVPISLGVIIVTFTAVLIITKITPKNQFEPPDDGEARLPV
ncbi:hypothetical protein MMYC01_206937 [Madurella mycetomatis]|uniref:Magnesium transport protein CorA n=1 Tax=Madurella mycetomatis TaxID=100816 RepID=A0A175VXL0_9PEZI|nr:hypothetical protein MMYC01_206937 [Madurella mycetomatis]